MRKLILLGAGGHAKSCIEVINSKKQFKIDFLVGRNNINNQKIFDNRKIISEKDLIKNLKK